MSIDLLGLHEKDLEWYQMCIRALIVFIMTLIYIRIAGMRTFGKKSAFDLVIALTLGAVLAKGITGTSPFVPTLAASFVMVIMHRFLAILAVNSDAFGKIIKGEKIIVIRNGKIDHENLTACSLSRKDLFEEMRTQVQTDNLEDIKLAQFERNGTISFIKK